MTSRERYLELAEQHEYMARAIETLAEEYRQSAARWRQKAEEAS